MITEDYVSFETAKLLKENGFDSDECEVHYDPYNHQEYEITLQMAMKWLREVHKLYIYVAHDSMENTWFARVYNDYKTLSDVDNYSTYEQACEAAIKYCLENLV